MKTNPTPRYLVLAGILLSGCLQVAAAPPGAESKAKTPAKPKLAPRAVPGMSGNPAPAPIKAMGAPVRKMAAGAPAPSGNGPEQAHIVMIYRRGSASLPATTPPQPSAPKPSEEIVEPVSLNSIPKSGEVRIITKEQAEKFTAKPEHQP